MVGPSPVRFGSMRRFLTVALVLALLSEGRGYRVLAAQACDTGPVALVLSGGGAKGLAHIGVIRALDSAGVRPALIVGTSMGALIGALYASGYSASAIDSMARSLPISDFFSTYAPHAPRSLGRLQPLVVWEQGERGFHIRGAAVEEPTVNALLNVAMLRGNLLARGSFDSLPIPFLAVATDLTDRSPVALDSGDLAQAVRASLAIPLIFEPVRFRGRVLVDGGLSQNIPVGVARARGATRVIVSNTTEAPTDSADFSSPFQLADHLLGFLFQQPEDSLRPGDIYIRSDVSGFRSLDFSPSSVATFIARGRHAADAVLARAACLPRQSVDAPKQLPSHFGLVSVSDASPSEAREVRQLLGLIPGGAVDTVILKRRLRRLAELDAYKAVWLGPAGSGGGGGDSIDLNVMVRAAPSRQAGLGLAFDNELGGRLWVGGVYRALFRTSLEASAVVFLGRYQQELDLGLRTDVRVGSMFLTPTLSVRGFDDDIRAFDSRGNELPELATDGVEGFLGLEQFLPGGWSLALGATARTWDEPNAANRSAAGVHARVEKVGRAAERLFLVAGTWSDRYRQAEAEGVVTFMVGPLKIRPRVRLGWGEDLPLDLQFPLGGNQGFPGLHLGERRGSREVLAGMTVSHPIVRILDARLDLVVGRSGADGPLFASRDWLVGARVGIGADTPIGPVRVEYGLTDQERDALFIRIGQWF